LENESIGVNPNDVYQTMPRPVTGFEPKCLKLISELQAVRYRKIRNVLTYMKLQLPIAPLYVLDDQVIIERLAQGDVSRTLESDLTQLIKSPLVIRIDINTTDMNKFQLLPRMEFHKLNDAALWLKEQSKWLRNETADDVIFIFHNFIPAISSAFAYAAPGERKVLIEALWGLPEGLYYNSHDEYIVDTQTSRGKQLKHDDMGKFKVIEKPQFKRYFISPDDEGHWVPKILKRPFDYCGSIQQEDWVKEIALESRRIAEEEDQSLSIMWFVGVPDTVFDRPVLPWYHEIYNPRVSSREITHRTKTPFDKSLVIKTGADIDELRREELSAHSKIRRIRIQPLEEELLRNKDTLQEIGELAKKIGAVILLEGGVLSHVYYQLMQTNAIVEVLRPFNDNEDKQEFYKLVRDKVPYNIFNGGEIVRQTHLSGELFLRALKEKLIEESFEVLDAADKDSIIGELADVNEVIDGILTLIDASRDDLNQRQEIKRNKAGGFKEGLVLLAGR